MLTEFQAATGGYYHRQTGELWCVDCVHENLDEWLEDGGLVALSRYALEEEQDARLEDWSPEDVWGDEADQHKAGCAPALEDERGHELVEAFHYDHQNEEV